MDRLILIYKYVKIDFYFIFFMYGVFNKIIF